MPPPSSMAICQAFDSENKAEWNVRSKIGWDGMDLSTVPLHPLPERQLGKRGQNQVLLLLPLFSTPWPPWARLDCKEKTNICALLLFIAIGSNDDILEGCLDFSPPGAVCMMKQSHTDQQ